MNILILSAMEIEDIQMRKSLEERGFQFFFQRMELDLMGILLIVS